MQAAATLAAKGLYTVTRNNPRVGCLVVKDGVVLGRGWYKKDGGPHAEIAALKAIPEGLSAEGSTVYVTLEPCSWEGRTGACTEVLIDAKVGRVVIGQLDPNPNVDGQGMQELRRAGIEVELEPLREIDDLNSGQFMRYIRDRPWIRIKSAISADGKIGMASGESKWITGKEARADVQQWRARSSAILTGIGTVLADNPQLTVRDERFPDSKPLRVVCDSNARIPTNARILRDDAPLHVATRAGVRPSISKSHISWSHSGKQKVDLQELMAELAENGVNELLIEAGTTLTSSFFEQGLWDEWIVYLAPKLLGSKTKGVIDLQIQKLQDSVQGQIHSVTYFGEDVCVIIRKSNVRS